MEYITNFYDQINRYLGVTGPGDLIINPVFLGFCIMLFLYTLFTGMKYMAILIAGFLGTAVITHYFYPSETSDLGALLTYVGILGLLALVLIYFGFIRE